MRVCVCVCVAKPVAVELRYHATALILVIGKAQFRRSMLSCDSSCYIREILQHIIWACLRNVSETSLRDLKGRTAFGFCTIQNVYLFDLMFYVPVKKVWSCRDITSNFVGLFPTLR